MVSSIREYIDVISSVTERRVIQVVARGCRSRHGNLRQQQQLQARIDPLVVIIALKKGSPWPGYLQ